MFTQKILGVCIEFFPSLRRRSSEWCSGVWLKPDATACLIMCVILFLVPFPS